jgi:hypothetical protein
MPWRPDGKQRDSGGQACKGGGSLGQRETRLKKGKSVNYIQSKYISASVIKKA